jgi:serine/threonine protein kinase/Tol biopolymer transport system component
METISHYRILKKLGQGGMAEVFLAEDTRLKRKVALKFLSAEFTSDAARLSRFRQEARAASSLNHPSILTVFDIGEVDSAFFIATEYVEGETLRRRISRSRMDLAQVLDVAVQVASALAAAHKAGIVHRDVKPENIMLRPDGYVKLLDFGIAKLTETRTDTADTKPTGTLPIQTEPGLIMGSPRYMSPEQVRGIEVDSRTDIFSLAVVVYEMTTGRPPFEGSTISDAIVAVLHQDPPPLSQGCPIAPIELQNALTKALQKDREQRYRSIGDLLTDLKRIRQQLDLQDEAAVTLPNRKAVIDDSPTVVESAGPVATRDADPAATLGSDDSPGAAEHGTPVVTRDAKMASLGPLTSDHPRAGSGVFQIVRHRKTAILVLTAASLIAAGFVIYRRVAHGGSKQSVSFEEMTITRITQSGNVTCAAISPDGKYAVYAVNDRGQESLWVRQLATDSAVQIAAPVRMGHAGLTFSGDGNFVYYTAFTPGTLNGYSAWLGALYEIATLGGAPKKLIDDVTSPVAISPDGGKLAFVRDSSQDEKSAPEEDSLMIADADGGNIRKLFTRQWPDRIAVGGPAWLPDGSAIACSIYRTGEPYFDVLQVGVADRTHKALVCSTKWSFVGRLAWLPDGSGPLMIAQQEGEAHSQLWRISIADGKAVRVTNDLSEYSDLVVTADARVLVAVQKQQLSNVWIAPVGTGEQPIQITSGANNYSAVAWTADGKLLYSSNEPGIWVMDEGGGNRRQLSDITGGEMEVSPDGASIAFSTYRDGTQNVWVMTAKGDNPKRLTQEDGSSFGPSWRADGKALIYQFQKRASVVQSIRRLALPDLATSLLVEDAPSTTVISPDGKSAAYVDTDNGIVIASIAGEHPIKALLDVAATKTFSVGPTCGTIGLLSWSLDGRSMLFRGIKAGVANVWSQSLAGGPPKELTSFNVDHIYSFDVSRDGKKLACVRGTETNDAVVIRTSK